MSSDRCQWCDSRYCPGECAAKTEYFQGRVNLAELPKGPGFTGLPRPKTAPGVINPISDAAKPPPFGESPLAERLTALVSAKRALLLLLIKAPHPTDLDTHDPMPFALRYGDWWDKVTIALGEYEKAGGELP